ncbi:hypothetical protein XEUV354_06960 [Xanthomonas euvesicatoria]|nr:hypothetical protein XEU66b_23240 [Xanthomonas euvesicatoria]KHL60914.1 hypothetical protein XEU83M_22250 [Xanthomonas euvesicatoria]KLA49224.1 hypothetical protein XEUV683_22970 [Xanthomonas euvesicatoria]KLA49378.1 hypothetical protein XEUV685_22720 [Xanthomonas euvesicatoria]KLA50384.1 hypothetical protein XEUV684_22965 [Xanthomonas euvesicatoria]
MLTGRRLLHLGLLRLHLAIQRQGHRIGLRALQRLVAGFLALGCRNRQARGIAAFHCLHFQRASRFSCLMWLRPWVGRSVSRAFACLLVMRI